MSRMKPRRPLTIKYVRKTASMLLFSAGKNKDIKRGVTAMRDLLIAGIRIELKYRRLALIRKQREISN